VESVAFSVGSLVVSSLGERGGEVRSDWPRGVVRGNSCQGRCDEA
jgi:hypothetical protein